MYATWRGKAPLPVRDALCECFRQQKQEWDLRHRDAALRAPVGGGDFLMCDECYDDSYVNYPVYVHPPPVRSYEQYPKKVGKIIETWFGLGTVPREDESVQEYIVENQERPRLLIELAVWSAMGGFFALRDGFRTISKKLHGVCLHPSSFVCAEEALYSEKTYKGE